MKYYETCTLSKQEREKYEKMGLSCYDLRQSDFGGEIASIENFVLVNRCGSMITNKEINFEKENFIDYDEFVSINKSVNTIEDLVKTIKFKNGKER